MPAQNAQNQAGDDNSWEGLFGNQSDLFYSGTWNPQCADSFMDYQLADVDMNTFMSLDDMAFPLYEPFTSALTAPLEQVLEQPLERRRSSGDALVHVEPSQRDWFASTYQDHVVYSQSNYVPKKITFVNENDKYFKQHRASTGSIRMSDIEGSSTVVSSSHFRPVHSTHVHAHSAQQVKDFERRRSAPDSSTCILTCPWNGCAKGFNRMYNLQSHYRTHTKEKPFGCPHCPLFFARNHDLKRHQRTHSAEKQFVCPICMRKFSRSDALHRHRTAGSCFKRNQVE